jgi:hypothetical protein
MSPLPPCGFEIFDGITLSEWTLLAKEYFRNKHDGEQTFRKWIREKFYSPLKSMLNEDSWFIESLPHPDDPEEQQQKFSRAYKEIWGERELLIP